VSLSLVMLYVHYVLSHRRCIVYYYLFIFRPERYEFCVAVHTHVFIMQFYIGCMHGPVVPTAHIYDRCKVV